MNQKQKPQKEQTQQILVLSQVNSVHTHTLSIVYSDPKNSTKS